jgi:hypothetical protein
MASTDFSSQNLVFWNLFEFSAAKNRFKINISHTLGGFQRHQEQLKSVAFQFRGCRTFKTKQTTFLHR